MKVKEYQFSVVQVSLEQNYGIEAWTPREWATFTELSSAKAFAKAIVKDRVIPLTKDDGIFKIIKSVRGRNPIYGETVYEYDPEEGVTCEKGAN